MGAGKDRLKEGDPVWARSEEEGWLRGVVASRTGSTLKVRVAGGSLTVGLEEVEYCSTTPAQEAKVEDMTKLPDLHHPALLATLNERFKKDKIYTHTGPILIAVNPFKALPTLYENKRMLKYLNAELGQRAELAPHAWNLAHSAYNAMIDHHGRNQSILVSGESGAGKTVSTKIVMNYLTVVSSGNYNLALDTMTKRSSLRRLSRRASKRVVTEAGVSQRVLEANPLMEAFGNAKTLRNDNSSRFGKLIQLQFHEKNFHLVGASIDIYLLEKSRVVHQVEGERNYHIFYELAKGLSAERKAELLFPDLHDCRYTNVSGCFRRADVRDAEQFKQTQTAFDIVGFSLEEQDSIFRLTTAILHMGNLDFDDTHVDGVEGSRVSNRSQEALLACADLLSVKPDRLEEALTTRSINVGFGGVGAVLSRANISLGENFVKRHTAEQATMARDGLAQTLYERLFAWIVWRINESISLKSKGTNKGRSAARRAAANGTMGRSRTKVPKKDREYFSDFSIGCLDIFGFEVFEKNSFEQLLINFTNEQLQNQFNEFVFELEQAEYEAEGIDWTVIEFPDNSACLEMIEARPIGLLSLVDEECLYPNGTDQSLANKLYQNLPKKYDPLFRAGRNEKVRNQFIISHFAGDVVYDVETFCRKNKNELRQEAVDLMRSSKTDLFSILLPADAASGGGGADPMEYFSNMSNKPNQFRSSLQRHRRLSPTSSKLQSKTVSTHFKTQLAVAMNHIRASEPHYIRCLKSNDENVSDVFDRVRIEEQLRYSGVLEVVKVARAGYSTRFALAEFAQRFATLAHRNAKNAARKTQKAIAKGGKESVRHTCEKILDNSGLIFIDDYQIGHTKIFLKPHAYSHLEIQKADLLRHYILVLQRNIRIWLRTYRATRKLRAAKIIQRNVRGYLVRRHFTSFRGERKAAIQIQRIARGMIARQHLAPILKNRDEAASKIKRAYKRKVMKDRLREIREESMRQRAAIMLQGIARVIKAQKVANNLHAEKVANSAALSLQSLARVIAAKKTKEMLRQEREAELAAIEAARTGDGGESGAIMLYIVPLAVMFLLANPALVLGLVALVGAMALGGGLMLEAQERQRNLEQDSKRYVRRARRRKAHSLRHGTQPVEMDEEFDDDAATNDSSSDYFYSSADKHGSKDRRALTRRATAASGKSKSSVRSSVSSRSRPKSTKSTKSATKRLDRTAKRNADLDFFKAGADVATPLPRSKATRAPVGSRTIPLDRSSRSSAGSSRNAIPRTLSTGGSRTVPRTFSTKKSVTSVHLNAFDDIDKFGLGSQSSSRSRSIKNPFSRKSRKSRGKGTGEFYGSESSDGFSASSRSNSRTYQH